MVKINWDKLKDWFFLVVAIVLIITLPAAMISKFSEPISIVMDGWRATEPQPYYGDMVDFLILAKRWADNNEYNVTEFNCVNYSQGLYDIAQDLGFKVEMVKGCPEIPGSKPCHRFLRLAVDFEPQDAEFTDYSKKYPRQEVIE